MYPNYIIDSDRIPSASKLHPRRRAVSPLVPGDGDLYQSQHSVQGPRAHLQRTSEAHLPYSEVVPLLQGPGHKALEPQEVTSHLP